MAEFEEREDEAQDTTTDGGANTGGDTQTADNTEAAGAATAPGDIEQAAAQFAGQYDGAKLQLDPSLGTPMPDLKLPGEDPKLAPPKPSFDIPPLTLDPPQIAPQPSAEAKQVANEAAKPAGTDLTPTPTPSVSPSSAPLDRLGDWYRKAQQEQYDKGNEQQVPTPVPVRTGRDPNMKIAPINTPNLIR